MKIAFLTLFILIVGTNVSNAQWTVAGSDIYNTNTGNMGVGTTTPAQKLTVSSFGDGTSVASLLRLEQYNAGSPVAGTGVAIDMAIGDNYNLPRMAGQIRVARSNYSNSSMYFATALANVVKDRMVIDPDGNVGIGTLTPSKKLTVSDFSDGTKTTPLLRLEQYNPGTPVNGTGVSIDMAIGDNYNAPSLAGQIRLVRSNYNYSSMYFATAANNVATDRMVIDSRGNVGIGTMTPSEALSVNGKIRAQEVKVETNNWPDYVFKQDYQLTPLTEIKTFIDQYQHLPEIPSAKEMAKEGLNLGDMNKLLIKKVEELTLYLIHQNKQLTDQLKVNTDLEERLKKLENTHK